MSKNARTCERNAEFLGGQDVDGENYSSLTISALLKRGWLIWRSNAWMFVFLMGLVIAVTLATAMVVNYVIAPHPAGVSLREVWQSMGLSQKLAVFVLFLITLNMQYCSLAASVFATQEIWSRRSVRFWQALKAVRRKQLRLFWMVLLASMVTGPLGVLVGPILLFALAPGFPVAILEGKAAIAAVKRGDTLMKQDQKKIAILVTLWLGIGFAAIVGWVRCLAFLQDQFGQPLPAYLRPIPAAGLWLILLIPQFYMIVLTLIYLERRKAEIEGTPAMQTDARTQAV
jgi:hypothetical protein